MVTVPSCPVVPVATGFPSLSVIVIGAPLIGFPSLSVIFAFTVGLLPFVTFMSILVVFGGTVTGIVLLIALVVLVSGAVMVMV